MTEQQSNRPRFDSELAIAKSAVFDYVRRCEDWYQKHKRPNRILFRASGVVTITLGALIPLLNSYEGTGFHLSVSIIGVTITCLTGFGTFYRWERAWRNFSAAQFTLDYHIRYWELEIARARSEADEESALAILRAATKDLLDKSREAQRTETDDFFQAVMATKP